MAAPTAYQYAKLGSNVEFLRGISSVSLMQTASLIAFPHLLENLPPNAIRSRTWSKWSSRC